MFQRQAGQTVVAIFPQNMLVIRKRARRKLLSSTGRNFWTFEGKILIYFERSKHAFRVPQKQISGGTVGIPVKYLSGKLLTVQKKNQLQEFGFILNLMVLVRLSESVIQTTFCAVEKYTIAIIFSQFSFPILPCRVHL